MSGKLSLSATNLAVHQHLNCDLYIHNVYHGAPITATAGSGAQTASPTELAKAQYRRGLDWEATLYSWLDERNLLLRVPSIPLEQFSLLENILADDRTHFFIAGLSFWPPQQSLTPKFKDNPPFNFGLAKPDLLEVERTKDGIQWRVIDAKASSHVKTAHHIQIYFYTLCLNIVLSDKIFNGTDSAGVWLPPKDGFHSNPPSLDDIKTISMSLLAPPLDALIFRTLPKVISTPYESVNWHFNPLCHGCNYESTCKERAITQGAIGTIPNISIDDARELKDLLKMSHPGPRRSSITRTLVDIEELQKLVSDRSRLDQVVKLSPSIVRKAKRILALPKKQPTGRKLTSPVIDAALTKRVQVINRRNYTCPSREDIAVFISVVNDPASAQLGGDYFYITSAAQRSDVPVPEIVACTRNDLIPQLANLIEFLETSPHTVQFYVWSAAEQGLLQSHIINAALIESVRHSDIKRCIGALSQGASLLQTTFQPLLLSGALMSFMSKGRRLKSEYQACLRRLGLSAEGTVDVLRKRLDAELRKLQDEVNAPKGSDDADRRKEFAQLPRVVILKKEVERQLALPCPGYWDLPSCATTLINTHDCPSDEEVFTAFKQMGASESTAAVDGLLSRRTTTMHAVLKSLRTRAVSAAGRTLFVNEAKCISTKFMDFCQQEHLRKLFFMQQFEVLAKLTELWQSRIDGCPDAPTMEYCGNNGSEATFRVLSGTVDVPASDRDYTFFDKLLVLDTPDSVLEEDSADNLPVEALFDDLGVSGLIFPLNRWTKANWSQQDRVVQDELSLADVRNVYVDRYGKGTMVSLRLWGTAKAPLVQGATYRLSPRHVDFNTTKVLSSLFEIDLSWETAMNEWNNEQRRDYPHGYIPFLQLILDPSSLGKIDDASLYVKTELTIQKGLKEIDSLSNAAGSLVLKASQHRATQRILSNRLSVIWGPPGTGKTYTISLSLLRLIQVGRRHWDGQPKIIFISAITHAAIEACRSKLVRLIETYKSIESYDVRWLDNVKVEIVSKGGEHQAPSKTGDIIQIYMGTIYQLHNFTKRNTMLVDCVIIDEAGQMSLGSMSLVLRSMAPEGRIIIAGDSEQLAPILSAQYPLLKRHTLFGSILDCVMSNRSLDKIPESYGDDNELMATQNSIIQLTENFRLNPDIGDFVSTIYARRFKSQKISTGRLAGALKTISNDKQFLVGRGKLEAIFLSVTKFFAALSDVMLKEPQSLLVQPEVTSKSADENLSHRAVSLAMVKIRTWYNQPNITYEQHVRGEAAVAVAMVLSLQKSSPDDDIFVATPHRIQRETVKALLAKFRIHDTPGLENRFEQMHIGDRKPSVTVDTIERLQGSEASFVICLFSLPKTFTSDLAFMLERRRLNVAISRAKSLCILITSDEVLCPSVKVLANEETAKGYAFLKAYQKRSWSYDNLPVNLKLVEDS